MCEGEGDVVKSGCFCLSGSLSSTKSNIYSLGRCVRRGGMNVSMTYDNDVSVYSMIMTYPIDH